MTEDALRQKAPVPLPPVSGVSFKSEKAVWDSAPAVPATSPEPAVRPDSAGASVSSRQREAGGSLRAEQEEFEKQLILDTLRQCHFNCSRAASRLGIHRTTLYGKMRQYQLNITELRDLPPA